jgi:hypothetical protein
MARCGEEPVTLIKLPGFSASRKNPHKKNKNMSIKKCLEKLSAEN